MGRQHLLGKLKSSDGLFAAYARKMIQEFVESISGFEIIDERFHRHASPNEDRRAPQNIGIAVDDTRFVRHGQPPFLHPTAPRDEELCEDGTDSEDSLASGKCAS